MDLGTAKDFIEDLQREVSRLLVERENLRKLTEELAHIVERLKAANG